MAPAGTEESVAFVLLLVILTSVTVCSGVVITGVAVTNDAVVVIVGVTVDIGVDIVAVSFWGVFTHPAIDAMIRITIIIRFTQSPRVLLALASAPGIFCAYRNLQKIPIMHLR